MSDYLGEFDEYEDDDNESSSDGPAELRKAQRRTAKENKALKLQLEGLQKQVRSQSVKDVLAVKGLNPKIAAFIPSDVESTSEAITAWVDEYAEVFALPQGGVDQEQQTSDVQQGSDPAGGNPTGFYTPEELQAQGVLARADGQASSISSGPADLQAQIEATGGDPGKLAELLTKAGHKPVNF